jgi:hypothetical protein
MEPTMPRVSLSSLFLGTALMMSGCHSCMGVYQETVCGFRDHHEAKMAWCAARDCYIDCQPHLYHFGLGFIEGYEAVAGGSEGCPPAYPPQCMWGPRYQTCEGREQILAWYNGYSHGAAQAHSDGVQQLNGLVTARDIYGGGCRNSPVVVDLSQFQKSGAAAEPIFEPTPSQDVDLLPIPGGTSAEAGILPPAPPVVQ